MASWQILTSGPCPKFEGTTEEAMKYVEKHAPLKRGWTGQWATIPGKDGFVYRRFNSKGKKQDRYTVSMYPRP